MIMSASNIDSFNRLLTADWMDDEKLIAQIKRLEPESEQAKLGKAFHDIIEDPHNKLIPFNGKNAFKSKEGVIYPFDVIKRAYEYINYQYPFEVKIEKTYRVLGRDILVRGRVDQLPGNWIKEIKTTWSTFDYSDYYESYQWRLYLDMFEADRIDYVVFQLYNGANEISLKEVFEFNFTPYNTMQDDIVRLLEQFIDWIRKNNLESFFINKDNE